MRMKRFLNKRKLFLLKANYVVHKTKFFFFKVIVCKGILK